MIKFNSNEQCIEFIENQNLNNFKKIFQYFSIIDDEFKNENNFFLKGYLKNKLFEFKDSLNFYLKDLKEKFKKLKLKIEKNYESVKNKDLIEFDEYKLLFNSLNFFFKICENNLKSGFFLKEEINEFYFNLFEIFIEEIRKLKFVQNNKNSLNFKNLNEIKIKFKMKEIIKKMKQKLKKIENIKFKIQIEEKNEKLKKELDLILIKVRLIKINFFFFFLKEK